MSASHRLGAAQTGKNIWQKLSKQWQRDPGNIPLDSLPAELLLNICSWLDRKDVQNFRLACKAFGAVGAEYLLDEIHLICKRSDLERMLEISENAVSKEVCSLYYEADLLKPRPTFEEWNQHKSSPFMIGAMLNDHTKRSPADIKDDGVWTARASRANNRHIKQLEADRKKRLQETTQEEFKEAYRKYQDFYADQERIFEEGFDVDCFEKCFKKCRKIQQLFISVGGEMRSGTSVARKAYAGAMDSPYGDSMETGGVRQLIGVLRGAHRANLQLKGLYAGDISHRFFAQSEDIMRETVSPLKSVCEIELTITTPYEDDVDLEIDVQEMTELIATFEGGGLCRMLTSAPLVNLDITLPDGDSVGRVALKSLVGSHIFECLRKIRLFCFETTKGDLLDFLLRHKNTLVSIDFTDVYLSEGSWPGVFRGICKQLKCLRRFKLMGDFQASPNEKDFWFSVPYMDRCTQQSWAMDRYVRKGGPMPVDRDSVWYHVPDPMNHGIPGIGEKDRIDDPRFDPYELEDEWETVDSDEEAA